MQHQVSSSAAAAAALLLLLLILLLLSIIGLLMHADLDAYHPERLIFFVGGQCFYTGQIAGAKNEVASRLRGCTRRMEATREVVRHQATSVVP